MRKTLIRIYPGCEPGHTEINTLDGNDADDGLVVGLGE
jgi:hypothetical protein